jgi:hypothetical protein
VDQPSGTKMADERCTCCPYGYHIDLDFLKYLDSLYSGEKLRTIRRVRHNRVPASRSCDGFFSDDEVTRWRNYAGSTARSPLSPQSTGSGGNITTDEILLEIDTSMSKTLTSIEEVDSRVIRKKKPPRPLPDKGRIQNGFGVKQTVAVESIQRETTSTVTSAEMTSRVADSASGDQLSGDISPAALQAIRDQLVVSLQRMRQLEDQVRVIPVMEEQLSLLREENNRLRKMLMSSETEQVRTVRDSRGAILVELPINVGKRELRSIGVGDNDVYGKPEPGYIFDKYESSSFSRETRSEVQKTKTDARREFFKGYNESDSGRLSSGWTGRLATVKAVCSTGVGDGNVLDYDKMGLLVGTVQQRTTQNTTTVRQSAFNHAAAGLQETRINLRVTVSEERNLSEPRWEVERFGTGRFQDVAVQCTIIGGVLSARWRRSADDTNHLSPLLSASVLQGEEPNEDFIEEPQLTATYREQNAAVWDEKLAQLLKTELEKLDDDVVVVEEKAISVNTQSSSFNWNDAFDKIGDDEKVPVPSDVIVEEKSVSVNSQPAEFNWNNAFDRLEDPELKKEELVIEADISPINAATEKSVEWQSSLDELEANNSSEQADIQPFPPVLSPIRAYSGDELSIEEINDEVKETHVNDQCQSDVAAERTDIEDSSKTEIAEEIQNCQTEAVPVLLKSDVDVDQTDVVIESQQTQTYTEAVVDISSSVDKTEASFDVSVIQETTTEQRSDEVSCEQTEVISSEQLATVLVTDDSPQTDDISVIQETTTEQRNDVVSCEQTEVISSEQLATVLVTDDSPQTDDINVIQEATTEQHNDEVSCEQIEVISSEQLATVLVTDDSPQTDDVSNSVQETLFLTPDSTELQQITDSSVTSEAAVSDVSINEQSHVTNVVVVEETTTYSETNGSSVDGVVEVSVSQAEVNSSISAAAAAAAADDDDAVGQICESYSTSADDAKSPISAIDAVQIDDNACCVTEETRHTSDVDAAVSETITKGCRIIITETRIERQLISSEADHSQLAVAVDQSEQANSEQLQTVAAETDG